MGIIGKVVRDHRGPAAVIGDESHNHVTAWPPNQVGRRGE
jgi:hypothetical protein